MAEKECAYNFELVSSGLSSNPQRRRRKIIRAEIVGGPKAAHLKKKKRRNIKVWWIRFRFFPDTKSFFFLHARSVQWTVDYTSVAIWNTRHGVYVYWKAENVHMKLPPK